MFAFYFTNASSQEINPFERIGKEGKILTLSKGKYTEVHIDDSLQRIGSVIVNMNSGTIYELLNTDTLYSEATLDPTVISRWYSRDPKESKYPDLSPYNFVANSPLLFIDPNGEDLIIYGEKFYEFKAQIEKQFHGLITVQRDENNKVALGYNIDKANASMVGSQAIMENQKNKQLYKTLNKLIEDDNITQVSLASSKEESSLWIGAFRGENEGGGQFIDMGDIKKLDELNKGFTSGVGAIIHELEEAYNDQVVQDCPDITSLENEDAAFKKAHDAGIEAQRNHEGVDELYIEPMKFGNGISVIAGKKDEKGNLNYTETQIRFDSNNAVTSVKTRDVNIKTNEEGRVTRISKKR